jgi:hypothetical protein
VIRKTLIALSLLILASACNANAPFLSTGSGLLNTGVGPLSISAGPVTLNPLGMNMSAIGYSSPELPFLNIVKSGGQESDFFPNYEPWLTANGGTPDTHEEAYLQLDSKQYVTSLTASPTPGGGQVFTSVCMLLNWNLPTPPGASYPYGTAGVSYRVQYTGNGTITFSQDATASLAISDGGTHNTTFTVATPSAGLKMCITAIGPTSYPHDISVVESAYTTAYDAGAIFHPKFLAALAGVSLVRPMQWTMGGGKDQIAAVFFTTGPASGSTSGTLSSAWTGPTATLPTWFSDGELRPITYTLGSTSVTWSGALTNTVTTSAYQTASGYSSWATRPMTTLVSYYSGMPYEIEIALANALTADLWLNTPIWFTDADQTSLATLVHGSLGITQRVYPEVSNEVWNSGTYLQFHLAGYLGGALWPGQPSGGSNYAWSRNYFGMRTANMASTWQSVWGSDFSRVYPVLGSQGAATTQAVDALQCTYYASAPCSSAGPIKVIAINPYYGNTNTGANAPYPSQADVNTIVASGGDGGLTCFFSLMTTNVGTCGTLASVPTAGWLGDIEPWITNYQSLISSTYSSMKLAIYEGGTSFMNSGSPPTGWQTLVTTASRDARIGVSMTSLLDFVAAHTSSSKDNIFVWFTDVTPISVDGDFGVLESVQQTVSPLLSSPYKFQAIQGYIQ